MSRVEIINPPLKSKGDTKDYRLLKLENGLKALLVSKPIESSDGNGVGSVNELVAAACLTVRVGSFDEPRKALGLAHFLEHMVHMGSERYPEESGYNDFLTSNGGDRNASTSNEFTNYYFSVSEKAFPEALDRFEQMIEAPLLSKTSMQREREAVDSEYNIQKPTEAVGFQSIVKSLINDSHPASQFDFGNLKSLKDDISDDDLHSELVKFHAKYVARKMYLAVQSNRSLDELQELVVKCFSGIKKGDDDGERNAPSIDEIFKPEFYNKIYFIKSKTAALEALILSWALPSVQKHYKCAPIDYLAHILANDGMGGIASYLKSRHYITNIGIATEVNGFSSNSQYSLARFFVDLTAMGKQNIDKILEAIASYLLMIKETPIEDHRRFYQELKEKTEVDFNFHKESSPVENVVEFASNMLNFNEVDTLRGNNVFQEFDEDIIIQCINALNEMKFNLVIVTNTHESFNKVEAHFGSEYDDQDFPEAYKKIWRERKLNPNFFLQKPNPFKATNFEIYKNEEESTKYPVKILENGIMNIWHTLDKKFRRPHVSFRVQLISPVVESSNENFLKMLILSKMFNYCIYDKVSEAASAGYIVRIVPDRTGVLLSFEGFNDKISMVIDLVTSLSLRCASEIDVQSFETVKEELYKDYSSLLTGLIELNNDFTDKTFLQKYFSPLDFLKDFNKISFNDIGKFSTDFFQKLKIEILAQGNITKAQTLDIARIIQSNLNCEPLNENYVAKRRCYHMPIGSSVIRLQSLVSNDENSCIRNHYQIGRDTLRARCLARLIEAILNPKVYDYLRTKEQLGYTVACQLTEKGNAIGIEVIVLSQEHKHPYAHVLQKMEVFMNEIARKAIEELTDEDFESIKEARIKKLLADKQDLDNEVEVNWYEIKQQEYVFNRLEQGANITKNLTKLELQNFFRSFTLPENKRKLSVQVIGNRKVEGNATETGGEIEVKFLTDKLTEDENIITNIKEFQNDLYLYPIEKFQI